VVEGTLELIKACPDFKLYAFEIVHKIGNLGWREVVLEYCLYVRQRSIISGQSDRLYISLFRLGAIRETLEDSKSLIESTT